MKRVCNKCGLEKDLETGFYKRKGYVGGYTPRCRSCTGEQIKQWWKKNPDRTRIIARRHTIKKTYGISEDEYKEIAESQNNVCAICKQTETSVYRGQVRLLAVDHDHKTGKVRALLCSKCNIGLGLFRDNPELLIVAAAYITGNET